MSSSFSIRPGTTAKDDGRRLLGNFDSQLPWLPSVGSGDQWGMKKLSTDPKKLDEYRAKVQRSEAEMNQPWTAESTRTWFVEATVPRNQLSAGEAELLYDDAVADEQGMVKLPVAAVIIEGKAADYVHAVLPAQDDEDPFIFVKFLLTDRRAGAWAKGSGAFGLRYAVDRIKELGFKRATLDCWSGNDRKLVQ